MSTPDQERRRGSCFGKIGVLVDNLNKVVSSGGEGSDEDTEILIDSLDNFYTEHENIFTFPDLNSDLKKELIEGLVSCIDQSHCAQLSIKCLCCMRVLTRDKTDMVKFTEKSTVNVLVKTAGLIGPSSQSSTDLTEATDQTQENGSSSHNDTTTTTTNDDCIDYSVAVESLKCLCNLVFQNAMVRAVVSTSGCLEGLIKRIEKFKDKSFPYDIRFFDLRLLFLLTALCPEQRGALKSELKATTVLHRYMEHLSTPSYQDDDEDSAAAMAGAMVIGVALSEKDSELIMEIFKVQFNLTMNLKYGDLDVNEEDFFKSVVLLLRHLLMCSTSSQQQTEQLHSHCINQLTNIPASLADHLMWPMGQASAGKPMEYDGHHMGAVMSILDFLHVRIERGQRYKDTLTPVLTCLCEIARVNRNIRKFCRIQILPPLRNVEQLPEEGNQLRNRLVKLMTSPLTEVKELAADFIFILCKENVQRLIKYTGYGNAAGLLAMRGLMTGGTSNTGNYSSGDDDTDTEEYTSLRHGINPVTGRWEEPKCNPMEGMTEEQKEYEADKLAQAIDKMSREGIITPCVVGADGKPIPVVEMVQQQQIQQDDSEEGETD